MTTQYDKSGLTCDRGSEHCPGESDVMHYVVEDAVCESVCDECLKVEDIVLDTVELIDGVKYIVNPQRTS